MHITKKGLSHEIDFVQQLLRGVAISRGSENGIPGLDG